MTARLQPKRSRSTSLALVLALASYTATVSGFTPSTSSRRRTPNQILFHTGEGGDSNTPPLFDDFADDTTTSSKTVPTTIDAQFGESVPLKNSASFGESAPFKVGESVPLKKPTDSTPNDNSLLMETATTTTEQQPLQAMKERNIIVAIASILLAVSSYVWQFTHPITPVQLLATMQSNSAPLTAIGSNGKPTVVDFWAPWCENCKMAAPTLQRLEEEYKDQVNFVMVNGDRPEAWPLIERFGVDAIPHIALISAEGDVETALIGPIPKRVLEADLDVLLSNAANAKAATKKELPFQMLDVFANAPEFRRIKFVQVDPVQ